MPEFDVRAGLVGQDIQRLDDVALRAALQAHLAHASEVVRKCVQWALMQESDLRSQSI